MIYASRSHLMPTSHTNAPNKMSIMVTNWMQVCVTHRCIRFYDVKCGDIRERVVELQLLSSQALALCSEAWRNPCQASSQGELTWYLFH